jgi:hypothetical protein
VIHETDAVIAARRETWRKAIEAARASEARWSHTSDSHVARVILSDVKDAAAADGVTFGK